MSAISVSTVTPVYSGEDYLPELVEKLEELRENWHTLKSPVELAESIFVIDGAIDNSAEILSRLSKDRPWMMIVNLSRNFGQHSATVAGILHSSGDWVVTLDEDLQHDPELIESILQSAVYVSDDIVYANPIDRVHEGRFRDWASCFYKAIVARITGNSHVRKFNSFRLVRGVIARAAASVCSHETYFDIVLCWFTDRISSMKFPLKDTRNAQGGKSGYTLLKLQSHARKMIFSSETKIVRLGALLGFMAIVLVIVLGVIIAFKKITYPGSIPVTGWTSLFITVIFFGGLLAILSGIILEYITVIMLHIQGKPTFFVVDRSRDATLARYYRRKMRDDNPSIEKHEP